MTSAQVIVREATARMAGAGVPSPRVDAELMLCHVLDVTRSGLALVDDVPDEDAERFAGLVHRRERREPLQHLLGTAAFRHLDLAVGPGVFVPRPETELLVDAVLPALRHRSQPVAVDLCAGSGALGLALATEVPAAQVTVVERSADALVWLERNLATMAVGSRVHVVRADVRATDAVLDALAGVVGLVDVVVANPPYVPAATAVGPEVAHDPAEAVFGGPTGLDLIPAVVALAARLLRPGGVFAMEHDDTQGESVPALLSAEEWTGVSDHRDLAGRPRFVTAVSA